jgi:DNA-binding protein H-NS
MPTSLSDLIAQKEAVERQIRAAQSSAKTGAVAQVRKLMAEHGLTAADIVSEPKAKARVGARTGSKVAAKFSDPATGLTWSGRGLKPKWLTAAIEAGKSMQDFAI